MNAFFKTRRRLSSFQIIIIGFASVIIAGALLLMLPISSNENNVTPFNEAVFTSASAVCVTGLVVHDTATYWSVFGQTVIMLLIQAGGLGVITVAVCLSLLAGRKISLKQRSTMQDAISAPTIGGIVKLTGFILKTTLIVEAAGAALMVPIFYRDFGIDGIRRAVFHSISAFCNAGFDIMGTENAKYRSLAPYAGSIAINTIIMLLIIFGGLGFLTLHDICQNKHHLKRYKTQSKVILLTTGLLIILPAIFFFLCDFRELPMKERVLYSLFQAVTPRTAGFNTADLSAMTESGRTIIIVLMLVGGSPGSTAGGMKTTTLAVLLANAASIFKRRKDAQMFDRRMHDDTVKSAATVLIIYLALMLGGAIAISTAEGLPMDKCLFETASAVGTVGLTLGLTPGLGILSQTILILLMFVGRVGSLTLIYAAISSADSGISKLPQEKIMVG